jgi:RNA polymerase sigma-70 factor (ECF subfamily)
MPPQNPEQARWFADHVQPHSAALRAHLLGQFPLLPDVDDIVQESLVRMLRLHETAPVDSPKALLFAIARNLALDAVRRQRVIAFEPMTETTDSFVSTGRADVAESAIRNEELDLLRQAIQSLPERCRQVFTLRMAYGLSQREIAARLGITENTVERQMGKGYRRCTEFFARHGLP